MTTLAEFCPGAAFTPDGLSTENLGDAAAELTKADPESVVMQGTEILQTVVTGAVGAIPTIGGVLSGAIGYFWPKADNNLWGMLQEHVENLVRKVVAESTLDALTRDLDGFKEVMNSLDEIVDPKERETKLGGIVTLFEFLEPTFIASRNPERMLPYIAIFGSFYLTMLRERARARANSHGASDPDAQLYLAKVATKANAFLRAAAKSYVAALTFRRNQITVTSERRDRYDHGRKYNLVSTTWTVRDAHDDWSGAWVRGERDGYSNNRRAEEHAWNEYHRRARDAEAALSAKLRPFQSLSNNWTRFLGGKPDAFPPTACHRVWSEVAGVPTPAAELVGPPLPDDGGYGLRWLSLWAHDFLGGRGVLAAGFETTRGAVDFEPCGLRPQSTPLIQWRHSELRLEPGERVVAVCVTNTAEFISGLGFLTDRGRTAGVSVDVPVPKTTKLLVPPVASGATGAMVGLRLKMKGDTIVALQVEWEVTAPAQRAEDFFLHLRMARLPERPPVLAMVPRSVWAGFLDLFADAGGADRAAQEYAAVLQAAVAKNPDGSVDFSGRRAGEAWDWVNVNRAAIYRAAVPRDVWNEFIVRFQGLNDPEKASFQTSHLLQQHALPLGNDGRPAYGTPEGTWVWDWVHRYQYALAHAET